MPTGNCPSFVLMFSCVYLAQLPGCSSYSPLFQDSLGVLNYRKRLKICKSVFRRWEGLERQSGKAW